MEKCKNVKEVCEITGLNRKLLYIYDKEGIVKPTRHKNVGHEGIARKSGVKVDYDGYKQYNDEAVRKLQQIAIYEKLRMKRTEIKQRLKSGRSDVELLEEQIRMNESHMCCPICGVEASGLNDIQRGFEYKTVKEDIEPFSECRQCRGAESEEEECHKNFANAKEWATATRWGRSIHISRAIFESYLIELGYLEHNARESSKRKHLAITKKAADIVNSKLQYLERKFYGTEKLIWML